jgi:hypothetical protein
VQTFSYRALGRALFGICVLFVAALGAVGAADQLLDDRDAILTEGANIAANFEQIHLEFFDEKPTVRRDALKLWYEQNVASIDFVEQRLSALMRQEAANAPQPLPVIAPDVADASPAMQQFLGEQAGLQTALSQLQWEYRNVTPEQFRTAFALWQYRNDDKVRDQLQLAVQLGSISNETGPDITIEIPVDATPETREFLLEQGALLDEQFELQYRLKDATPEQRREEWKRWQELNLSRLEAHFDEAPRQ